MAFAKCKGGGALWYVYINPQEDATIAAVDFEPNTSVFAVMDGHGGKMITKKFYSKIIKFPPLIRFSYF